MKRVALACTAACLVASTGCQLGITRIGYTVAETQSAAQSCQVRFRLKARFDELEVTKLGTIVVHDHNLSSQECDIATVLGMLRRDACYLGADVVNITEEKQPDYVWSICYRATADFLRMNDPKKAEGMQSDPRYDWAKIEREGAIARQKGKNAYWKALGVGLIGGLP